MSPGPLSASGQEAAARLSVGGSEYSWHELRVESAPAEHWAHHDVAAAGESSVFVFDGGTQCLVELDIEGGVIDRWRVPIVEGHGLCPDSSAGEELVWIADPGFSLRRAGNTYGATDEGPGKVVAVDRRGRVVAELPEPAVARDVAPYRPTSVAVEIAGARLKSIWISDGYGRHLVHRLSPEGELELTLTGEEGAGRFDCPHTVYVDYRMGDQVRVYVTDRGHSRIQVFDRDGTYLETLEADGLEMPSNLACLGDSLVVADLNAKLVFLDADDRLVAAVGNDTAAVERPGWPNEEGDEGPCRPSDLKAPRFNSPHGLTVTGGGDIVVAEWVIGGRLVALHPETNELDEAKATSAVVVTLPLK